MAQKKAIVPEFEVESRIYLIRGERVMLDSDLAGLYGTTTKALLQAMKRNQPRFPADFVFQLDSNDLGALRSQIVTSNLGRGGRRYLPYAFTEHGAIMLASVLNSARAVEASIFVVRAFAKMRAVIANHRELSQKLSDLERRVAGHDQDISQLIAAIRQLMTPSSPAKRKIGFRD